MQDQNQNTKTVTPPTDKTPPRVIDGDYETLLLDITGITPTGVLNDVAIILQEALFSESEIVALVFTKAMQATLLGTADANRQMKADLTPTETWGLAITMRASIWSKYKNMVEGLGVTYKHEIPPQFSTPEIKTIGLRAGGTYSLRSSSRNTSPVYVDGRALMPGESIELTGVETVDVSSHKACLLHWSRIGGEVRTGTLAGILPKPRRVIEPVVEVVEVTEQIADPKLVSAKSRWSFFLRGKS